MNLEAKYNEFQKTGESFLKAGKLDKWSHLSEKWADFISKNYFQKSGTPLITYAPTIERVGKKAPLLEFDKIDLRNSKFKNLKFSYCSLKNAKFQGAHLEDAEFFACSFSRTNFRAVVMLDAYMEDCFFINCNFKNSRLGGLQSFDTIFEKSNFQSSGLDATSLFGGSFKYANLRSSDLRFSKFYEVDVDGSDLTGATIGGTTFFETNLSSSIGLNSADFQGFSAIDGKTLIDLGAENSPFLRGIGLPERLIEYLPSLKSDPIQFFSCFISYSSQDDEFVRRLHADLQDAGIRTWFAPEDLKTGDRFRQKIDEAIRIHDRLLLVLSENSIGSAWVEKEAETAMERERRNKRDVLFPISLDGAFMQTDVAWTADIRRTRHTADFSKWKSHDDYKRSFDRLLRDLRRQSEKKA